MTALRLFFLRLPMTPPRRILITCVFLAFYPPFILMNRIGLLLDRIFFSRSQGQPVQMPLHLMGSPRSGTTYLFSLFGLDRRNFSSFTFHSILFPSITMRVLLRTLSRIDGRLGGFVKQKVVALDRSLFGGIGHIHQTGIFHPEEDIMLLFHTFLSPFFLLLFPFRKELPNLATFLDRFPAAERQRHMAFYRKCIKAHLFFTGGEKRLLSKNVYYLGSMKTLLETFPTMKILYVLRNPCDALASFQSMLYVVLRFLEPKLRKDSPQMQEVAKLARDYYGYGYQLLRELPAQNVMVVTYDEVIREPRAIVERVYQWMGLEIDEVFARQLDDRLAQAKQFKSKHSYDPQEFGIDEELIYQEFSEVFAKYGFARRTSESYS
jgi:hypothetical protein